VDITNVQRLTSGACEAVYRMEVDGTPVRLRLWIIIGGTPALAFDNYSYTARFDKVEKFSNANWNGNCYNHQTRVKFGNVDFPPSFEDLPNGMQDVHAFLQHAFPLRAKRDARMAELPQTYQIRSRRVHDREERTYVWAKIDVRDYGVAPVTFESAVYDGRCEDKIAMFPWYWQLAQSVCNPIFDRHDGTSAWESLSDSEFQQVKDALWTVYVQTEKAKGAR
jgi:hypothetical protein